MFLDSSFIPTHIKAYLWFTAIYIGLKTALFWALMLIGFVGFQFAEDGTLVSLLMLCISSIVIWVISFAVSAKTFLGGIEDQGGLWFFEFVFPIIMVLIYVVSQVILVIRTLDELWPINDIALGCLSFVAGLILQYTVHAVRRHDDVQVLGFHHERRPRIQCGFAPCELGRKGPFFGHGL